MRIPATLHEIIKEIFSLFEAQLSLGSSEGREVREKHFLGDGGKERAWNERHPAPNLFLLPPKNTEFLKQTNREGHSESPLDGHRFFSFRLFDRYWTTSLIGIPFASADEELE